MKKYIAIILALVGWTLCLPSHAASLKNISLEYCQTSGNILTYTIDPEVQQEICYTLTNDSDQPVTMNINFIDGTYTNDQRQNRACLDESSKENFGQYVSDYERVVTLTGGESRDQTALLRYPAGSDGSYHGCVSYAVAENTTASNTQESSNFSILMRKAKFIDVLVGHPENLVGGIEIKDTHGSATLSPNNKIRIYQDPSDNKYVIELTIQNVGSIEESVAITGVVSNIFNYKYTFVENRTLLKGQQFIITKKLEERPNYYFNVDVDMAYTPVIS